MSEFFTKIGNGFGFILIAGAAILVLITFLKSSNRSANAGDYIQRVKVQRTNTKQGNHVAIICAMICVVCFVLTTGTLRWITLIVGILLVVMSVLPNLMKNNSKEYQQDVRKYTKYKHQMNAQTSGAKGAVIGASAAGVAAGVAISATGVGAPVGVGIAATSIAAGATAGKKIGTSTKGVHKRRAEVMNDVPEDFSNTIDENMLEDGTENAIGLATDLMKGKPQTNVLDNMGTNSIEAYKRQGLTEDQIAHRVHSDLKTIEQQKSKPTFMDNDEPKQKVPSFVEK